MSSPRSPESYSVESDIASAHTLPGAFYADAAAFGLMRERVFARTWQWLGPLDDVAEPESLAPRTLLPGDGDEIEKAARGLAGAGRVAGAE